MIKPSLATLFREKAFSPADCAHIAVDVQFDYASRHDETATRITAAIAPAFNRLGIPTCWIYLDCHNKGYQKAGGGPYKIRPAANDRLIAKTCLSAFDETNLDEVLRQEKKRLLFVTGFDFGVCVYNTIVDAVRLKYSVALLRDGTNENAPIIHAMEREGVIITDSTEALKVLSPARPNARSTNARSAADHAPVYHA